MAIDYGERHHPCVEYAEKGSETFWSYLSIDRNREKGLDVKRIKECSEAVGLGGIPFFPSRDEAKLWGKSNFIKRAHKHNKWRYVKSVGKIFMAGKNHTIAKLAHSIGYPKTTSEIAFLKFLPRLSKLMEAAAGDDSSSRLADMEDREDRREDIKRKAMEQRRIEAMNKKAVEEREQKLGEEKKGRY